MKWLHLMGYGISYSYKWVCINLNLIRVDDFGLTFVSTQ